MDPPIIVGLFGLLLLLAFIEEAFSAEATRLVFTKQGPVRGRRINVRPDLGLGKVDAFYGLPYASPPTGRYRYMPPSSPQAWSPRVREAVEFAPVCPQVIPDLSDQQKALRYMTVGRLNYLKKLFKHLQQQSEDCLYLNVYTPTTSNYNAADKINGLPVMVFIHGESYEWNSGNPYDGSVLASYGQVVIVTLNYRLGVLGFLRPGLTREAIGNFGLFDQIAALHWIQENIAAFGGDPNSVTLVGHGSGAALVSLLLTSPVAKASQQELFQRAILMSGTALSPIAMCREPEEITMQVYRQLNCTSSSARAVSDVSILRCLQDATLQDLLTVQLSVPMYTTPFGPIVDGVVIPEDPFVLMSDKGPGSTFSNFDVMFGLTQSEAFHLFPASTVTYGVSSKEQRGIVRTFLRNVYKVNVEQILTAVMNEYTDYRQTVESKLVNRATLLEIFSDARVAAPLIQTAGLHATARQNEGDCYMYVFKHVTKRGYYPEVFGSLHGEEVAYSLGMPLSGGSFHLQQNYTFQEQVLSEVMMHYWITFARTGQPSKSVRINRGGSMSTSLLATSQSKRVLSSPFPQTMDQVAPSWPPYDPESQKYMTLDLESAVNSFYRPYKMALWNLLLPDLVAQSEQEKDVDKLPHSSFPSSPPSSTATQNSHSSISDNGNRLGSSYNEPKRTPSYGRDREQEGIPVVIVVIVGIVLLMLNVCACGAVIYQKNRVRQREDNLRRRLKRLSDAGVIHHQSSEVKDLDQPRYCGASNNTNNEDDDDEDDHSSCREDSVDPQDSMYVIHGNQSLQVYHPAKSAMRRKPDNRRSEEVLYQPATGDFQTRYTSRSVANNLDTAVPMVQGVNPILNDGGSRNVAALALDVVPRRGPDIIYDQDEEERQPRKVLLPKVLPDLPSVCHSIRNRFVHSGSTASGTSTSTGSRPPSPIIEVVPVSEYESNMYHHHQLHQHQLQPLSAQQIRETYVTMPLYRPSYGPQRAPNQYLPQRPPPPPPNSDIYSGVVYPLYHFPPPHPASRTSSGPCERSEQGFSPRSSITSTASTLPRNNAVGIQYGDNSTQLLSRPPFPPLQNNSRWGAPVMQQQKASTLQHPPRQQHPSVFTRPVSNMLQQQNTTAAVAKKRIDFNLNTNKAANNIDCRTTDQLGNKMEVGNTDKVEDDAAGKLGLLTVSCGEESARVPNSLASSPPPPTSASSSSAPLQTTTTDCSQQKQPKYDNKDSSTGTAGQPNVRGPVWQAFAAAANTTSSHDKVTNGEDCNNGTTRGEEETASETNSADDSSSKSRNLQVVKGEEKQEEPEHYSSSSSNSSSSSCCTVPSTAPLATTEDAGCSSTSSDSDSISKTPVLKKVGEKTPPGTLKRSKDRPTSSCKSWCAQYSQTFLAKTIDTPLPEPTPFDDDFQEEEDDIDAQTAAEQD